jgi:hypothetical protein
MSYEFFTLVNFDVAFEVCYPVGEGVLRSQSRHYRIEVGALHHSGKHSTVEKAWKGEGSMCTEYKPH